VILLKKWKISAGQNANGFFLFFLRKFCHDFATPFSTFANNKRSYPTYSTTPDPLR